METTRLTERTMSISGGDLAIAIEVDQAIHDEEALADRRLAGWRRRQNVALIA